MSRFPVKIIINLYKRVTNCFTSNTLTWLCLTSQLSCRACIKFQTFLSCQCSDKGGRITCSFSFVKVAFLCFLQYGWWLNTRMRPDQTASTLWTTNSSCTTRQTTLTTGASSAASAGNLTIVCWSDRVVLLEKCVRGMQIQDCLLATNNTRCCHQHYDLAASTHPTGNDQSLANEVPAFHRLAHTTCGFGQKKRSLSPRLAGTEEFLSCHPALGATTIEELLFCNVCSLPSCTQHHLVSCFVRFSEVLLTKLNLEYLNGVFLCYSFVQIC